jgi:hypothetical protein
MVGGKQNDNAVRSHRLEVKIRCVFILPHKRHVELASAQLLDKSRRRGADDPHLDIRRMCLSELRHSRNNFGLKARKAADPQDGPHTARVVHSLINACEDFTRVLKETPAGLCEHDTSRASLEELNPDRIFQFAKLAAE